MSEITKGAEDLLSYYERQIGWSRETFGPALRTKGVLDHIRKELCEIEQDPHDLSEWVDVIILAMDGFWRHGGNASDLFPALLAKQKKNMARTWPDWRTMSEDKAIEHDRSKDSLSRPEAIGEPEPEDAALIDRLRNLVDNQTGGDALVLVQRQLFNKVVGRLSVLSREKTAALKEGSTDA